MAGTVQTLHYAGMNLMPLLGLAASNMAGDTLSVFGLVTLPSVLPINQDMSGFLFSMHGWCAIGLLGLIALHITGALRHHLILRDDVPVRMVGRAIR